MATTAVLVFALILGALAVFQACLAAGLPLGRWAWGGQHERLPKNLRIGSAINILLYGVFVFIALERVGLSGFLSGGAFPRIAMWVLAGFFGLGVLMNGISRSRPERLTMTPVALVLAGLSFVIARS